LYGQLSSILERLGTTSSECDAILRWLSSEHVLCDQAYRLAFWRIALEHVESNKVIDDQFLVKFWRVLAERLLSHPDTSPHRLLGDFSDTNTSEEWLWAGPRINVQKADGYIVHILFWPELRDLINMQESGQNDNSFDEEEDAQVFYQLWLRLSSESTVSIAGAQSVTSIVNDPTRSRKVVWVAYWVSKLQEQWQRIVESSNDRLQNRKAITEVVDLMGLDYRYDGHDLGILWIAVNHPGLELFCPTVFDAGLLRHEFVPDRVGRGEVWGQSYHYTRFTPGVPEAIRKPLSCLAPNLAYYAPLGQVDRREDPLHGPPSLDHMEDVLAALVVGPISVNRGE